MFNSYVDVRRKHPIWKGWKPIAAMLKREKGMKCVAPQGNKCIQKCKNTMK